MRHHVNRKSPRFFIINPVSDRRRETRFQSQENVVIRDTDSGMTVPAEAFDIGEKGCRLECKKNFEFQKSIQIAFPNSADQANCFGRVAWCRKIGKSNLYEVGISVHAWHGIVDGKGTWKKYKGFKLKKDRRNKHR